MPPTPSPGGGLRAPGCPPPPLQHPEARVPHALTHPGRKTCSVPPTASTRNHTSSSSLEVNMARVCRGDGLLLRGA